MNTAQNKRNERIHLLLMEISVSRSKLLTSLHKIHPITKQNAEDAATVEEMMESLDKIVELQKQLKEKYPIKKVIFK